MDQKSEGEVDNSYFDYFQAQKVPKEKLVYLTADSENIIDDLDPDAVYIIGGIVDRNRHTNLTFNKAQK